MNQYVTYRNGVRGLALPAAVVPEFVSDQDDPPLEQNGGEHLQQFVNAETLKQTVKVHVFQSGIHRSTQSYDLDSNKGTQHQCSYITNTVTSPKMAPSETDIHRCSAILRNYSSFVRIIVCFCPCKGTLKLNW